ncbi:hypothetical protein SAMN05428938_6889 [Streptomyces sp. KS_5]|nr:hypothetical protein SAMN05428938_6889 [Streptomyces sp. KS_5]
MKWGGCVRTAALRVLRRVADLSRADQSLDVTPRLGGWWISTRFTHIRGNQRTNAQRSSLVESPRNDPGLSVPISSPSAHACWVEHYGHPLKLRVGARRPASFCPVQPGQALGASCALGIYSAGAPATSMVRIYAGQRCVTPAPSTDAEPADSFPQPDRAHCIHFARPSIQIRPAPGHQLLVKLALAELPLTDALGMGGDPCDHQRTQGHTHVPGASPRRRTGRPAACSGRLIPPPPSRKGVRSSPWRAA